MASKPHHSARHLPQPTPAGAAPTRRALLTLLGTAPLAVTRISTATTASRASSPASSFPPDSDEPVLDLWRQLNQALAQRDEAIAARDRLEADLVRQVGHPRVQLPTRPDAPPRYAADPSTIDRALGPGHHRLRRRLKSQLQQHQLVWDEAAQAAGLPEVLAAEDAAFSAVEEATAALLDTPATMLAAVRLKLAVLIATGKPGPADRTSIPWAQLRAVLTDLDQLSS